MSENPPKPVCVLLGRIGEWNEATAWCEERFGPAHRYRNEHGIGREFFTNSWVVSGRVFGFVDPDQALEFKLRWG